MSHYKQAFEVLMKQEGGYVDHPKDPGGATNFGVSLRFYKDNINPKATKLDIEKLKLSDAFEIFDTHFWSKYKYKNIDNQPLANKALSLSAVAGPGVAAMCFQRGVLAASGVYVRDDGIMGTQTFDAINRSNSMYLMIAVKSEAANFYRFLVYKKPESAIFLAGWINRAMDDCKL